jgi:hypothetical protein
MLQPLVAGQLDLNKQELSPEVIDRTMTYLSDTVMEACGIGTGSEVARMMSGKVKDHELHDMRPEEAIDGHYIHLVRGELGVRRIGVVARATNFIRQKAGQMCLKIAGGRKEKQKHKD